MKSKVYAVQDQMRAGRGGLVQKFDLSPARMFGELVFVLPSDAKPFHSEYTIKQLHEKLKEIHPRDFILLVGNPVLIGWTVAIASYYLKGTVKCLQWEHTKQSYIPVTGELFSYS